MRTQLLQFALVSLVLAQACRSDGGGRSGSSASASTAAGSAGHDLSRDAATGGLTAADFRIDGIGPGLASDSVRSLLGTPQSVTFTNDPRDPSARFESWHYRDLIVVLYYDTVGAIWITGPTRRTARGLTVGDSQPRVSELYGSPSYAGAVDWQYGETDDYVIQLTFVNGRVRSLFIGHVFD